MISVVVARVELEILAWRFVAYKLLIKSSENKHSCIYLKGCCRLVRSVHYW